MKLHAHYHVWFFLRLLQGRNLHVSIPISTIPDGFGLRLTVERKRLGLTQAKLAEVGGVKRLAQSQYERGASFPTVRYLAAIGRAGVNLSVVLFDQAPSAGVLPSDEQYRIERQAFDLLEAHVRQQPEASLGAEGRFALFQLLKSQLTQRFLNARSEVPRVSGLDALEVAA